LTCSACQYSPRRARTDSLSQLLARHIERLVASFELTNQSLILEGVHLDVALITALLARHTSCIPFLIYISNEAKHRERFAVRSAVMSGSADGL